LEKSFEKIIEEAPQLKTTKKIAKETLKKEKISKEIFA
jgi:hypothetical protein